MSKTHWRKILESDYLAGADLDDGKGNFKPIVATIKRATEEAILEPGTSRKEKCLVLHFQEKIKPMICNVTNAKRIQKLTGSPYMEDWGGQAVQIKTERVKAFGELHNALRIDTRPPRTEPVKPVTEPCSDCGGKIEDKSGVPAQTILAGTVKSYGRALCMDCANKAKEATSETN